MASKVTLNIKVSSSGAFAVPVNIVKVADVTAAGDENSFGKFTASVSSTDLPVGAFSSVDNKVWIYMQNSSKAEGEKIWLSDSAGADFMVIGPGEFALFPYGNNTKIKVKSSIGSPVLYYACFEV